MTKVALITGVTGQDGACVRAVWPLISILSTPPLLTCHSDDAKPSRQANFYLSYSLNLEPSPMQPASPTISAFNPRHLISRLVILLAAGLVVALMPRDKIANHGLKVDPAIMFPKRFSRWRNDDSIVHLQVGMGVQAMSGVLHSQARLLLAGL